ncbi:uncharacterized protein J4E92_008043 [Alternaria infectoria]|uniref:uncharacterized protein n=1 Tax=Alternaria infectoria TaxID=45303 RepID=UPI00221F8E1D|nr:uncharacterized protein J4E92_008043 [Alternaria infectoria]KAI4921058.1 hypothetical protein J4E92_008043 [Alternaria infectoria]
MEPVSHSPYRYAFNSALIGIEAPILADHTLLCVENWSNAGSTSRRVDDVVETTQEEEDIGNNLSFNDLCLWVGVRPARADVLRQQASKPVGDDTETQTALDNLKAIKIKKGSSVGSVLKLDNIPVWPLKDGMTRVVVRYNLKRADRLQYYELINRHPVTKVSSPPSIQTVIDGAIDPIAHSHQLSYPVPIKAQDVFFFRLYRDDDISASTGRQKGWTQNIKTYLTDYFDERLNEGGMRPNRKRQELTGKESPPRKKMRFGAFDSH